MPTNLRIWGIRVAILIATCLGVFVLPFLLPAPYFEGVSASNLAGFNNRVAVVAAAVLATLVFFLSLKWPRIAGVDGVEQNEGAEQTNKGDGGLSHSLIGAVVVLWGGAILVFGVMIIQSEVRYTYDWGYFINRVSMHADFGRKLYTQIEFAYGPLLFYGPIAVRAIFHVSAAEAYLVTLMLETMIGLLLVAYVIDHLPMSGRWKGGLFSIIALGMVVGNMGLNYTFFRFAPPLAFLVMVSQRKRPWAAALWIFAGQAVCLGISPEIGFAFFAGSFAYAVYGCFTQGRSWVLGVVAPVLSATVFLLIAGQPYLSALVMFSHGEFNFPVEPLPSMLVFLFALVWLVPASLARFFRQRRPEASMLAALYLVSLALLPAALGRADPGHVFFNGLSVFVLSIVAISSKRLWQQIAWGGSLAGVTLWMCAINWELNSFEMKPVLHAEIAGLRDLVKGRGLTVRHSDDNGFSMQGLQAIVGDDPVATPDEVPLPVEKSLRASRQYTPSFYAFAINLLDVAAEDREIHEFNQSKWALIPDGERYGNVERPENLTSALGFQLPYRTRRPVYAVRLRFQKNLAENWRVRGSVGQFVVYEHL